MKYIFITLSAILIVLSSCKKELQPMPGTNTIDTQSMNINPPPPPGTCAGNEWDYDHTFYPDWYEVDHVPDIQPIVYNNKVYIPDYDEQEVRIFNGSSWSHLPSPVPVVTNYRNFSFTIGNYAYVGYCDEATNCKLYQYNFTTNSWVRKADGPPGKRFRAAAFSIGTKGYVAGGLLDGANQLYRDLWEYNSLTNSWTQKANIPTSLHNSAVFVLNNKAYLVCGETGYAPSFDIDALYEYNPATNIWNSRASFPGGARTGAVAFVIDGKPYCGGGSQSNEQKKDFYRYNATTNTWTRIADMSLDYMKRSAYGFSINSTGYAVYTHDFLDNLYTVKYKPLICTLPL